MKRRASSLIHDMGILVILIPAPIIISALPVTSDQSHSSSHIHTLNICYPSYSFQSFHSWVWWLRVRVQPWERITDGKQCFDLNIFYPSYSFHSLRTHFTHECDGYESDFIHEKVSRIITVHCISFLRLHSVIVAVLIIIYYIVLLIDKRWVAIQTFINLLIISILDVR
jgi:hypothetical protein